MGELTFLKASTDQLFHRGDDLRSLVKARGQRLGINRLLTNQLLEKCLLFFDRGELLWRKAGLFDEEFLKTLHADVSVTDLSDACSRNGMIGIIFSRPEDCCRKCHTDEQRCREVFHP